MKIVSKASGSIKVMTYEMHILRDRCYDTLSLDRNTITRCSGVASESLPHSRLMQHSKRYRHIDVHIDRRTFDLGSKIQLVTDPRIHHICNLESLILPARGIFIRFQSAASRCGRAARSAKSGTFSPSQSDMTIRRYAVRTHASRKIAFVLPTVSCNFLIILLHEEGSNAARQIT